MCESIGVIPIQTITHIYRNRFGEIKGTDQDCVGSHRVELQGQVWLTPKPTTWKAAQSLDWSLKHHLRRNNGRWWFESNAPPTAITLEDVPEGGL